MSYNHVQTQEIQHGAFLDGAETNRNDQRQPGENAVFAGESRNLQKVCIKRVELFKCSSEVARTRSTDYVKRYELSFEERIRPLIGTVSYL